MVEILAGIIVVGLCIAAVAAVFLWLAWIVVMICQGISEIIYSPWKEPAWWWKGNPQKVEEERPADGPNVW